MKINKKRIPELDTSEVIFETRSSDRFETEGKLFGKPAYFKGWVFEHLECYAPETMVQPRELSTDIKIELEEVWIGKDVDTQIDKKYLKRIQKYITNELYR